MCKRSTPICARARKHGGEKQARARHARARARAHLNFDTVDEARDRSVLARHAHVLRLDRFLLLLHGDHALFGKGRLSRFLRMFRRGRERRIPCRRRVGLVLRLFPEGLEFGQDLLDLARERNVREG